MKFFPGIYASFLQGRAPQRNIRALTRFVIVLVLLVLAYSTGFHALMAREGRSYSWITGLYWTLTVMSTLGFGDITFTTDMGLVFSIVVLLTGTLFMLVLLPFLFIQFFLVPWMQAQTAARTPRSLPAITTGHIILTHHDPVSTALIHKLKHFNYPYVMIVQEHEEALRLHDLGFDVVHGDLDNPETYRRIAVKNASMIAATSSDEVNTHVAFTAREIAESIPVAATARKSASVDIMQLAGCTRVFQLGEMMGQALARRTVGNDAKSHIIGSFGALLIAEATAHHTPLVGQTLAESRLREIVSVSVVGIWERGECRTPTPETRITNHSVLVLAGTREQLRDYDELFCIYNLSTAPVVIIGGGRVGRATGAALAKRKIDYRIVELHPDRVRDDPHYVHGDAAELEVLHAAGIKEASTAIITPHNDDTNVYLSIYCRRLRPDIQIICRAVFDRNVPTLHRAGCDFVLSYASMGANAMFNILKNTDIVMLAEGLEFFKVKVPPTLRGKTSAASEVRSETGCAIVAVNHGDRMEVNPDPTQILSSEAELILIGTVEAEERFLQRHAGM